MMKTRIDIKRRDIGKKCGKNMQRLIERLKPISKLVKIKITQIVVFSSFVVKTRTRKRITQADS